MIETVNTGLDFSELHTRMQWYVDQQIIPCCNTLILKGSDVVDVQSYGPIDHESKRPLAADSIFRVHSTTKLLTAVAAMMLFEEGKFDLSDPLGEYLPEFRDMRVLKADATSVSDTEEARDSIRIEQLMSQTAGLSYGFLAFNPHSLIDQTYAAAGFDAFALADHTLESLSVGLSQLPLAHQPGTVWRYSYSMDILARLVEVISGQSFDAFLKERITQPLGMVDTDFYVPKEKQQRFTTLYAPTKLLDPMAGGYVKLDDPYTGSNSQPTALLSGGAGLMSTLVDCLALLQMFAAGGEWQGTRLLKPETLALMRVDQLPEGQGLGFPFAHVKDTGFGLGFALKQRPAAGEPELAVGEFEWGGIAGCHLWVSPKAQLAGICMTQLMPSFWHPFSHDFKRLAYQIAA